MLNINEIFYDIQGESSYTGLPCVFIRLSGCNLQCSYCDTDHIKSQSIEIDRIIYLISKWNCTLVEITGGEPLLQKDTPKLVSLLREMNYKVLIETNGSIDISILEPSVYIMDFKCPSSAMSMHNRYENINYIRDCDELKFVIGDRRDYEFAKGYIAGKYKIYFSPVYGVLHPRILRNWILEDNLKVYLHLQQHKVIENSKYGVDYDVNSNKNI